MKKTLKGKKLQISFKFVLLFNLILFLSILPAIGQGIVKGVITDKSDNTPLIAANVFVEGTTIGTVTNYNGEYTLPLKAGTYTLQVMYLGYEMVERSVAVKDYLTIELNAELSPISVMGEEVVVTVQAKGQLSAVNQQLRSNQIINVVSEERIRELPDENAAQAISRLPGVHLDGSKVVIRGLEPKMNQIAVNGINLPSISTSSAATEPGSPENQGSRAADLGIISANMLSGIEVYKTLTPDMDADAIGGVVNLRFREAQSDVHYSITAQGAYNNHRNMYGGNKLWGNVSNRFFDDRLGAILNLSYETKNGGSGWIKASYEENFTGREVGDAQYMLSSVNVYEQITSSETMGGSLVLDYDIGNGQLMFTSLLSHSVPEETLYRDALEPGRRYHHAYLNRSKYTTLLTINTLRFEQQLGIVKIDASISNSYVKRDTEFKYETRVNHEAGPFYEDSIITNKKIAMDPIDVYGAINPVAASSARYSRTHVTPNNYDEDHWMGDINLDVPVRITDIIDVNLKFGGKYLKKSRNYDESYLTDEYININSVVNDQLHDWYASQGIENNGERLFYSQIRDQEYQPAENYMNGQGYYLDWVLDKDFLDEMILNQVDLNNYATEAEEARYDYWGWESKTAGYLMAELNLSKRITLIPGFRYEKAHNDYTAYKVSQGSAEAWRIRDTITRPADHSHFLPHLHLRVKVTDWCDIRGSYNNTLSRPDYHHAVPSIYYHEISGSPSAGNPMIKPAVSENIDANITFFTPKIGLITIGGYLKNINDIFYMQPTLVRNLPDSTIMAEFPSHFSTQIMDFYVNSPYTAYVKGFETEWQSNFSWLPSPFNGIVLNANYTAVWSETKYMQNRILTGVDENGWPATVERDTFYVNRLLHQADDIANLSLGYDYKGFSARVSFRFQGNVISKVDARPEENEYTDNVYSYDLVIKQNIPLKYGELEVFFNAINFTNVPKSRYSTFRRTNFIKGDAMTYERWTGRQFQIGLRYKY